MSNIEWTDETWNPVVGCTRASAGCDNCYAVTMSHRLETMGQERYAGLTVLNNRGDRHFNGVVRTVPEVLDKPLRWRKPRMIFVNSMSDLFHPSVPFGFIDRVFAVMALCPRHTFQILTKRPERMAEYFEHRDDAIGTPARVEYHMVGQRGCPDAFSVAWPLPNVWLGTSCEDQAAADARIPHLLRCPAAVRFLSCEPLLAPIDLQLAYGAEGPWRCAGCGLEQYAIKDSPVCSCEGGGEWKLAPNPDWVIVGGESGKGARACDVAWVRAIVNQCRDAGVPCFVKQLGAVVWDRNDAGFDAETHTWAEGPDEGKPVDQSAWPTPLDVEDHPDGDATVYQGAPVRVRLHSRKGGDPEEWPEDLRVREMPCPSPERRGA